MGGEIRQIKWRYDPINILWIHWEKQNTGTLS